MLDDKVKFKFCIYKTELRGKNLLAEEGQVILYRCVKCGALVKSTELELGIRCPYCRYRVLMKERPPIVKRVKVK